MICSDPNVKSWINCERCLRPIPVYEDSEGYYWGHSCNGIVSAGRMTKEKPKTKEKNLFLENLKNKQKERWQR